jgi:hypothetical protein
LQPVAPWLQQQPALIQLKLEACQLGGPQLLQLPAQLEELDIEGCRLVGQQPPALTQLSRLRKLALNCRTIQLPPSSHERLPAWLSSLSSLEELSVASWGVVAGWEVLVQLPALRRVRAWDGASGRRVDDTLLVKQALPHAPHLCWSPPEQQLDAA